MTRTSPPGRPLNRPLLPLKILFVLLAFLLSLPAAAIELTGQIRGAVTDPDGLAVPSVVMNLTSPQMQGGQSTQTDASGRYRFIGLPPGDYRVEAAMAGFNTAAGTARVAAGLTANIDLTLSPAVAGEEMVIEEAAPVVDTTSTRSGAVLTREMLRDIPNSGRDYQSAMSFAPGVVDMGGGNPNVRGGQSFGNQYYVDGVNTTDPTTNTFSMNMNFDAIEEFQVITGGMDAEYGRSLGGAVNIVTRSGGNEFEGDAQFLYNGTATQVYKPMEDELNEDGKLEEPEQREMSLAMNVGGPIMKDKLWFFTGIQLNYSVYTPFLSQDIGRPSKFDDEHPREIWEMQSRLWKSAYLFGKATWKPAPNHRLWLHAQADPTTIDNADSSVYTLPSAELWWQQGGWLASLGHQWTPDSRTIVDTQISTSNNYLTIRPMQWKECTEYDKNGYCIKGITDEAADPAGVGAAWNASYDANGFAYGMVAYGDYNRRPRSSITFAVTRFVDLLGTHQFKAGVQADLVSSFWARPGLENGVAEYVSTGDPTDLASYQGVQLSKAAKYSEEVLKGQLASFYLQDVWQPWPRLTLRPGLRLEYSKFQNSAEETVYDSVTLAPRFGAAYDLTGDGRTKAHAFYGRFYDSGFLEISSLLSKGSATEYFSWDSKAETWATEGDYSAPSQFLVHGDLVTPHSDEYDIGLSRDVGGGWELAATFNYKYTSNLFEDDDPNLIWNADGTSVIGGRDGTSNPYFRLRTPDEAFIEYTSLEAAANKQFDEHWGMFSSYTWSRAYGRYRDENSYRLASAGMDVPELEEAEVGILPYDVPHNVKLAGSYRDATAWELSEKTRLGFLFGWNFELSSGTPYEPAWQHSIYGWVNKTSIDGSYRLPAYSRTDLKAGLTLAEGRTTWDLTAECFNVFNSRETTSVHTEAYDLSGAPITDSDGNVTLGQTTSRQHPRFFQLGLRGEF